MNKGLTLFFGMFAFLSCHTAQKLAPQKSEPHRPHFHFTPPGMWMNDPNGMVFFEGEYHLFYQYHPESTVWGPMHWGHAVSKDMVHWEHLPIALYPDSLGMIFSGSAVVDWNNTTGFGKGGKPPLVAIFTHHQMAGEKAGRSDFQYQSIAYSTDRGRTWTKYAGNPVVPNTEKIKDFRDPKVIWDEGSKQWVMVFAAQNHLKLWGSKDLKKWNHLSDFGKEYGSHGGVWECPDLFPMVVPRNSVSGAGGFNSSGDNFNSPGDFKSPGELKLSPEELKWVLLLSINPGGPNGGSVTQYFVGDFDGKNFKLDPAFAESVKNEKAVWLDWGRDNYAGVTWSDIPKKDGRRLFMGWMSNWDYATLVPTEKWRSAMTLPRQLALQKTDASYRLVSQPVKELESLRGKKCLLYNQSVHGVLDLSDKLGISPAGLEMMLEVELPENTKTEFSVVLSNSKGEEYSVGFNGEKNEFYSDRTKAGKLNFSDKFAMKRHTAPRFKTGRMLRLHLYLDVASCELFADGGALAMTDIFFPTEDFNRIQLKTINGTVTVKSCVVYKLKSSW